MYVLIVLALTIGIKYYIPTFKYLEFVINKRNFVHYGYIILILLTRLLLCIN